MTEFLPWSDANVFSLKVFCLLDCTSLSKRDMHLHKGTKALFTTPCARCVKKLESWLAVRGKRIRECACPCSTAEFAHLRRGDAEQEEYSLRVRRVLASLEPQWRRCKTAPKMD